MKMKVYVAVAVLFVGTIRPKAFMPSLDRVRKKVDGALTDGKTVSLKDFLDGNSQKNLNKILCSDEVVQQVEQKLQNLFWCIQSDWVSDLIKAMNEPSAQPIMLLRDKIKEHYVGEKMPIVTFAQALSYEEHELQDVFNLLLKRFGNKSEQNSEAMTKLKTLFDMHLQYSQTLKQLMDATNSLLM